MSNGMWNLLNSAANPTAPSFLMFDEPKSTCIGRTNLLKEIHRRLLLCCTQTTYLQRMVVLTGMPGIGKSEMARCYAKGYLKSHLNIAWIDASSENKLKSSFLALAHKLNVCEKILRKEEVSSEDLKSLVINIYHHFSDHVRCGLFIFDDAVQMRSSDRSFGIFDFLPKMPLEHLPLILVTSQNIKWGALRDKIQIIRIEEFSSSESLQFLANYFPFPEIVLKKLEPDFLALAKLFNGFPLGLDLAASNIADRCGNHPEEISAEIRHYIHNFTRPNNCTWLSNTFPETQASNNVTNLCDVWTRTLKRLEAFPDAGSTAIELLNLVSYLAPESIDANLCSAICENERPTLVSGKLEFSPASDGIIQGFRLLEKFSLVQVRKLQRKGLHIEIPGILQKCIMTINAQENENSFLLKILNYFQTNPLAIVPLCEHVKSAHDASMNRNFPLGTLHHSLFFSIKLMNRGGKYLEVGFEMLMEVQEFVTSHPHRFDGGDIKALSLLGLKVAQIYEKLPFSSDLVHLVTSTLEIMRSHEHNPWIQDVGINLLDRFFYKQHSKRAGLEKSDENANASYDSHVSAIMNAFMSQNGLDFLKKQLARWIGAKDTENSLYYHILSLIRFLSFEGGYTRSFLNCDDFLVTFKETTRRANETQLKNLKYWTFLTWFALFARNSHPTLSIRIVEAEMNAWSVSIPDDDLVALTEWKLEYDDYRNGKSDAEILAVFLTLNTETFGVAHRCALKLKGITDLSCHMKDQSNFLPSLC